MGYAKYTAGLCLILALPTANATVNSGSVTTGSGSFIKLMPGFTDSTPDNTVGNDNFQNSNLYAFDEDQNTTVQTSELNVDILASSGSAGTLAVGTVVASHYVFFDPAGTATVHQVGTVTFDSRVLAVIISTAHLLASDYLANTGVSYLNPSLRGLESGDSVTISATDPNTVNIDWMASTPGDYVRILTEFSPSAVPEAETYAMMLAGLGLVGFASARRKSSK